MCYRPIKLTILRQHSYFTVLSQHCGQISCAHELAYDEMLGYVARLLCPEREPGVPFRGYGSDLFLSFPKHPDAAGDAQPPAAVPPPSDQPVPAKPVDEDWI